MPSCAVVERAVRGIETERRRKPLGDAKHGEQQPDGGGSWVKPCSGWDGWDCPDKISRQPANTPASTLAPRVQRVSEHSSSPLALRSCHLQPCLTCSHAARRPGTAAHHPVTGKVAARPVWPTPLGASVIGRLPPARLRRLTTCTRVPRQTQTKWHPVSTSPLSRDRFR